MARKWDDSEPDSKLPAEQPGVKLEELMRRVEPLLEQVNQLYTLYATGVERLPPVGKRSQLEQVMASLQGLPKPNTTYKFRVNTLHARFVTMRERWDKTIRDIESGKIKRTIKR